LGGLRRRRGLGVLRVRKRGNKFRIVDDRQSAARHKQHSADRANAGRRYPKLRNARALRPTFEQNKREGGTAQRAADVRAVIDASDRRCLEER
jgi:hypothetical protein